MPFTCLTLMPRPNFHAPYPSHGQISMHPTTVLHPCNGQIYMPYPSDTCRSNFHILSIPHPYHGHLKIWIVMTNCGQFNFSALLIVSVSNFNSQKIELLTVKILKVFDLLHFNTQCLKIARKILNVKKLCHHYYFGR